MRRATRPAAEPGATVTATRRAPGGVPELPRVELSGPFSQVVEALPALGVRRLVLMVLQLATELDLAHQSGFSPGHIGMDTLRLQRAGTPFEQAFFAPGSRERLVAGREQQDLRALGLLIQRLLLSKPLHLEGSFWTPPGRAMTRVMRRRADEGVVRALCRGLSLIAQRSAGSRGGYESSFELVGDLAKLAALASRIVTRRRAMTPVVCFASPRPRAHAERRALPKVIIHPRSLAA